jgi:hypothetical protein
MLVLSARELAGGRAPGDLVRHYLTGGITKSLFNADPAAFADSSLLYLAYLVLNFLGLALPLIAVGAVVLLRRDRPAAGLLGLVFAIYAVFSIGYRHHGIWVAYTTHGFLPLAVLVGVGSETLLGRPRRRRTALSVALLVALVALPYAAYRTAPTLLRATGIRPFRVADPDRFHRWYLDPDQSGNREALETARAILDAVPDDADVVGDWGVVAVLRLVRDTEGRNPDVAVHLVGPLDVPAWLASIRGSRTPFLAHFPHYPARLGVAGYRLVEVRAGLPLHRIVPVEDGR